MFVIGFFYTYTYIKETKMKKYELLTTIKPNLDNDEAEIGRAHV